MWETKTFFYEFKLNGIRGMRQVEKVYDEVFVHSPFEKNPFLKGAPGQKMMAEIT